MDKKALKKISNLELPISENMEDLHVALKVLTRKPDVLRRLTSNYEHLKDAKIAKLVKKRRELFRKMLSEKNMGKFEPIFKELNIINRKLRNRLYEDGDEDKNNIQ